MTRRTVLRWGSGCAAAAVLARGRYAQAAPPITVHDRRVISQQPHLYHGWPTLARRQSGELLLVCSGGREAHVCPFGRVELMRSHDSGTTWTWPRVLIDSAIDDRDAGVVETADGSLLVTTFSSLAYEPILSRVEQVPAGEPGAWPKDQLKRWQAAHRRIGDDERKAQLGCWMLRSSDGGVSWSARFRVPVNSPHGPVRISNGEMIYAGKELWHGENRIGVCRSTDDGQTWRWVAEIPTRPGDNHRDYHELHAVQSADGRLIAHIRNHNKANAGETLQSESSDGGETWSTPKSIGVWGLPSHLLRLRDGRLLMSYGHRRAPLGNQTRISEDHGRSWSEPMLLSDDGSSSDLGYPSTIQLDDGSLLTVWYELMRGSSHAVLRQAHWSIG